MPEVNLGGTRASSGTWFWRTPDRKRMEGEKEVQERKRRGDGEE